MMISKTPKKFLSLEVETGNQNWRGYWKINFDFVA